MPTLLSESAPRLAPAAATCPFHDGAATLDLLLAEIDPNDTELFDAALDLRSLCAARDDAASCVEQLFRLRALLDNRHYLAFYRVRRWAQRTFCIATRAHRGAAWLARPLPLDCARSDELVNTALATLADASGGIPATAQVQFVFAHPNAAIAA